MTIKDLQKNLKNIAFPKKPIIKRHFGNAQFSINERVFYQGKWNTVIVKLEDNLYIVKQDNGIQDIAYNFYMIKQDNYNNYNNYNNYTE